MPIQNITARLISTLGNKESLVPIIVKDGVDSTCLTYKAYKNGGKVEGIERGIDEFGTQAIWIGGIPFFKKLIDVTAYKLFKINPGVDPRILKDKEYTKWALKNAKGNMSNNSKQSVKKAINDCLKDGGKIAKNLYISKILTATTLTLSTYFLMTKFKQNNTKRSIEKTMKKELENNNIKDSDNIFIEFNQINKQPSFKGIIKNAANGVMFNPVHNMKIIDAGITTERLACSRNKVEFAEHAIKEGGFLFSVYGLGNFIEKGFNFISDKIIKKPIDLNINVLMDDSFSNSLAKGRIKKDINLYKSCGEKLTDKLKFISENTDNIIVKSAIKSGIIQTVNDTNGNALIDTSKFIDVKAIDKLTNNLQKIDEKFIKSNENVKKFLNKTKGLKIASVLTNIGISCLVLGYVIPKYIYNFRLNKTGTTKFHVEENIKNKMEVQ